MDSTLRELFKFVSILFGAIGVAMFFHWLWAVLSFIYLDHQVFDSFDKAFAAVLIALGAMLLSFTAGLIGWDK